MVGVAESILIAVLTVLVSGGVSVFVAWRTTKAELQKEFDSRFNQKKWDVYSEFARIITLYRFTELPNVCADLLLVGSDEVIHELTIFLLNVGKHIDDPDLTDEEIRLIAYQLMDALIAMRRDLGYQTKISRDDLFHLMTIEDMLRG